MADTPTVYFAGAVRGNRSNAAEIIAIAQFLKSLPVTLLTEHVGAVSIADRDQSAEAIETRDIAWLDGATHVIAEISDASTGTGREIEYARTKEHFGKVKAKILCLYRADREFYASPMIRGMTPARYQNVVIKAYTDIDEAREIVRLFLNLV